MNTWYSETPWSFEDEGVLELEPLDGAERRLVIRHGQQKTGFLRVNSISFDGDGAFSKTLKHKACGKLNIVNARFWAFRDVYGIAVSLAGIIADDNEFGEAKQQAMLAALDCMWEIGPEAFGNPEFEYSGWLFW